MKIASAIILNVVFAIQVLLVFLLFAQDHIAVPDWLRVAGRMHPLLVHLPIGFVVFLILVLLSGNKLVDYRGPLVHLLVLVTTLAASVTALAGFFLSLEGGYGEGALAYHKTGGIILSFGCYALALLHRRWEGGRLRIAAASVAILLVVYVGHTGSALTRGPDFVLEPVLARDDTPAEEPGKETVYYSVIQPILKHKCMSCHNPSRKKGGLVMSTWEDFARGGKEGVEWVEGNPAESRIIHMLGLPLEDDKHMPPDGKPQISPAEYQALEEWIRIGAKPDIKLATLKEDNPIQLLAHAFVATRSSEQNAYTFKQVSADAIDRLNTPFCSLVPCYEGSPGLEADFFVSESFDRSAFLALKEVRDQLVSLNLSKMPVTDDDLAFIANFTNLERLNLNFSRVQGRGLKSLGSMQKLQHLSVVGTAVGMEDLGSALSVPTLHEVYAWNTAVTVRDKETLEKDHPGVNIYLEAIAVDDSKIKLSPPVMTSGGLLTQGGALTLKHAMPGVEIRYTLDGAAPDSLNSRLYKTPVSLEETRTVRCIACKDGWYCSDEMKATCFMQGRDPDSVVLLSPPDRTYAGEGAKSLTDGRKGVAHVPKEASWLGFRDNSFVARFFFDPDSGPVRTIVLSYCKNVGGYIFPPQSVEVYAGKSPAAMRLVGSLKPVQPEGYEPLGVEPLTIPLDSIDDAAYYRIVAKPVSSLPAWHAQKGEKGWVFIDEVFFY